MIYKKYVEHMVSLAIEEDTDNGLFAKVGKMKFFDEGNAIPGAISAYS